MKVNWDDEIPNMEKYKMLQTTNQIFCDGDEIVNHPTGFDRFTQGHSAIFVSFSFVHTSANLRDRLQTSATSAKVDPPFRSTSAAPFTRGPNGAITLW